jgi:uncharacterized membrane protein YkvA (DUF1232 family)
MVDWGFIGGVIGALLLAWLAFVALLWLFRPRDSRLGDLLRVVPDVLRLARSLIADSSAPTGVRLAVVGLLVWLVNPIDLVPEFIPVLGPLDDVVVAVLVLRYVHRKLGDTDFRRRWPGTEDGYRSLVAVLSRGEAAR